jgi:hypothetical protein
LQTSLSNLRVLCTGNPKNPGITQQVAKTFANTDCLHQSMGVDLITLEGMEYFKSIIKNYDVFINVSHIQDRTQERLLKTAYQQGMKGHVFNIGSIAEYKRWEWNDAEYTDEKRQLRETSLELCSEFFKTTHIVVGGFQDYQDSSLDRMDPCEVVKLIKYIIQSPVNIPLVGIEKINDKEMEKILNGRI